MTKIGTKKINWLLILQAWAMLWVVIGHAFLGKHNEGPEWETMLCNIAYSFHMPLFMLVSGWLFYLTRLSVDELKPGWGGQISVSGERLAVRDERDSVNGYRSSKRWTWWKIVKDKAVRLLLPGLVFSIVAFALKIAFPGEMSRQTGLSVNEIIHAYLYPYDNPFRELWFIATLFLFFLMTPLWRELLKQKWMMWLGVIALLILHFCHPTTQLLCIDRVCSFAIWFYLGMIISKENMVDKYLLQQPMLVLVAGVAIYTASRFIVTGSVHSFFGIIGGITFSFSFALLADKYIPKLFSGFRNYTYQIFLMGILAQMAVKIAYRHISVPYVAAYVVCILAGLYVPVVVSKVIEKINWKLLKLCVGLK